MGRSTILRKRPGVGGRDESTVYLLAVGPTAI
jgi:hypothetical protein